MNERNTCKFGGGGGDKCVESIVKIDKFFDKMLKQIKINKIQLSHCPVARGQLLAFVSHCLAFWEATSPQLVLNLRYDVLSVTMSELLSLPSKLVFTFTIVFFT